MRPLSAVAVFFGTVSAVADDAQIIAATAERSGEGWRVTVTLRHGDTGWDDYADGWRVVDAEGRESGIRELLHPHVDEQPFTRSLGGLTLDPEISYFVEARTSTDGWGEMRLPVTFK